MAWYTYAHKAAFDPNTRDMAPAGSVGQVYAVSDNTFSNPIPTYDLTGLPVVLEAVEHGFLPQFQVEDHVELKWKSGDYVFHLNTTTPLFGEQGETGKSAYESAVENGFAGTEPEWLDSLKGSNVVPTDEAIAGNLSTAGTLTHEALTTAINSQLSTLAVWVTSHGAVGDGESDDTAAIQAAIATANVFGAEVWGPDGTYKITAPLRSVGDGLTFRLSSGATIRRHFLNNMFINGADKNTVGGHSNIEISGGTWDANGLNFADWGSVFCFGKASNIYLHDMVMKNVCKSHLVELAGIAGAIIERVTFSGYHDPTGTRTEAEAFQIERLSTDGFPSFNIGDETPCRNITVRHCAQAAPDAGYVRWPVGFGAHFINTDGILSSNITVLDNDFGDCTHSVIRVQNWANTTISRNTGSAPNGILCEADAASTNNLRVLDNQVRSTVAHGINLSGITGAVVERNKVTGKTNGIYVGSSVDVNVGGNEITTEGFDAFLIAVAPGRTKESQHITIHDNVILSARLGVNVAAASSRILVRGNNFKSLSNHGVSLAATGKEVLVDSNSFVLPAGNRVLNFATTAGKGGASGNMYPAGTTSFQNGTAAQATVGTNYPIL